VGAQTHAGRCAVAAASPERSVAVAAATQKRVATVEPDNVLVGRDGSVRVTDFGLARSLVTQDGRSQVFISQPGVVRLPSELAGQKLNKNLTQPGALMGTPQYMAPEQYCGEPVDQRSDQFSFCVALYEALHGQPPFAGQTVATLCYNVINGNMQHAPAGARVPKWLREVLLRGLQTEPKRRYPSLDALLVALAQDPRRKRVRAAAVVGLLLGLGLLGAGYHRLTARTQQLCAGAAQRLNGTWDSERRAEVQAAILSNAGPAAPELWRRLEAGLNRYTAQWSTMHTDACQATYVRGEQSPALLDLRMRCLQQRLTELSAFTALLKSADREAAETAVVSLSEFAPIAGCADVEALTAPEPLPSDPKKRQQIEALQRRLSELRAAERLGKFATIVKEARAISDQAEQVGFRPLAAEAWFLLGELETSSGNRKAAAEALFRAALAGVAGHNLRAAAQAFSLLAADAGVERRSDDSLRYEQLAYAALAGTQGDEEIRSRILNAAGLRVFYQQHYDEALKLFQSALALREKQLGKDHPGLIQMLGNMSLALQKRGRLDEALQARQRALRISEQQLGPEHPRLALALQGLGTLLRGQGQYDRARAYYDRALGIEVRSLGPRHAQVASSLRTLGSMLNEQGLYKEATTSLRLALDISETQVRRDDSDVVRSLQTLAWALRNQEQYDEALALLQRALQLREQALGRNHVRVGTLLDSLSATRLMQGDYQGALRDGQEALAILLAAQGVGDEEVATARSSVGQALSRLNRHAEALQQFQLALALREKAQEKEDSSGVALALLRIADEQIALAQPKEALVLLARVLTMRSSREMTTARFSGEAKLLQAKAYLRLNATKNCAAAKDLTEEARGLLGRAGPGASAERAALERLTATLSTCATAPSGGSAPHR
jgi:tetratricopeptide (TPR) repeat protein